MTSYDNLNLLQDHLSIFDKNGRLQKINFFLDDGVTTLSTNFGGFWSLGYMILPFLGSVTHLRSPEGIENVKVVFLTHL